MCYNLCKCALIFCLFQATFLPDVLSVLVVVSLDGAFSIFRVICVDVLDVKIAGQTETTTQEYHIYTLGK